MIALYLFAFGVLWIFMHSLEEPSTSVGSTLMMILICYSFVSALFFITSGSSSVIQRPYTLCKVITAIVMNVLSICVATFGLIMLAIEFVAFEHHSDEYSWSNLSGMLLLHFTLLSTIVELMLTIILVGWFKSSLKQEDYNQESSSPSEISLSETSITP
ncbi:uncharacterized protein [Oryctolagus cuniculus]|uniref:Uncharacterized protein n=2 Tax=Oryctolagus cuniculus TaxID=9986 RepID=U3KPC7_RABIT|nr:uncharacterized protein LOC103351662 isoform X2 [Oryctolagus cuniculus]